jgi:hypothetical protein
MPYRVDDVINEYGAFREIVIDGGKWRTLREPVLMHLHALWCEHHSELYLRYLRLLLGKYFCGLSIEHRLIKQCLSLRERQLHEDHSEDITRRTWT